MMMLCVTIVEFSTPLCKSGSVPREVAKVTQVRAAVQEKV